MRVGIMTMHRIPNYGSFMQAYCLKKMIEELGHDVEFVDFHVEPDVYSRASAKAKMICLVNEVKEFAKSTRIGDYLLHRKMDSGAAERYDKMFACDFMLGVTRRRRYLAEVDTLVIGSDEVFNCLQPGRNVGYSLELFGKNARARSVISYAASFGSTTLERLLALGVSDEIGALLKGFNAISVRDDNSLQIVSALTGEKPLMHLDPVLVAGAERWSWKTTQASGYLLLYGYAKRFSQSECRALMNYAHSRGLKVLALGEDQVERDLFVRCLPDEVIGYFRSAECVVTDTFHGSIFSIITHRPFAVIPRGSGERGGGNEEKIAGLLKALNLESRKVRSVSEIESVMLDEIDYRVVDEIRRGARARSLDYLAAEI